MRPLIQLLTVMLSLALLCTNCTKKDTDPAAPGGNGGGTVTAGSIYFSWAGEGVQKINTAGLIKSTVLPDNTSRHGFDISWDGQMILTSADDPNDYDAEQYTLTRLSDNTIVAQFKKNSGYANSTTPLLSPDNTLIAVPPTFDNGVLILDTKGNILKEFTSFQGQKLTGELAWMPDRTLLIATSNSLYRTNTSFTQATLVKQFSFDTWQAAAPSRDGKYIAFRGGNHIWQMNADGSNMVQLTNSTQFESGPVFSPDGKYLLVGTDPFPFSYGSGFYYRMRVIPADGRLYNVDNDQPSPGVVVITPKGDNQAQPFYLGAVWR